MKMSLSEEEAEKTAETEISMTFPKMTDMIRANMKSGWTAMTEHMKIAEETQVRRKRERKSLFPSYFFLPCLLYFCAVCCFMSVITPLKIRKN